MTRSSTKTWDVFVSHASEDKDTFVRPLSIALANLGVSVWYDEFSLRVGDSLSRSIDKGLADSRFGLVIVSQAFVAKPWTEYELRGLVAREIGEDRIILPIWHGVGRREVIEFSPPLADKIALDTQDLTAQDMAIRLLREIRPDLYASHPRSELERRANGTALQELQIEIERTREELENVRNELAEYQCPICGASLELRIDAPADAEQKHWDVREIFTCGYRQFGGVVEHPCSKDPAFPQFDDYDLQFRELPSEPYLKWQCLAVGKTQMARCLTLAPGYGRTIEEAEKSVHDTFRRLRC